MYLRRITYIDLLLPTSFFKVISLLASFFADLLISSFGTMGWTYNTVDPNAVTNAPEITAVGVTLTVLSLIVVCLRLYVRRFMINAVGIGMLSCRKSSGKVTNTG